MPVLLPNALLSTTRATYAGSSGLTSGATPVLTKALTHLTPTSAHAWKLLPPAALESEFQARLESGADIRVGDVISAITLLDGVTPWPGLKLASTPTTNEVWRVSYVQESAAGVLPSRIAWLTRITSGGPVH